MSPRRLGDPSAALPNAPTSLPDHRIIRRTCPRLSSRSPHFLFLSHFASLSPKLLASAALSASISLLPAPLWSTIIGEETDDEGSSGSFGLRGRRRIRDREGDRNFERTVKRFQHCNAKRGAILARR